jgi:putative phosphoesterase
MATGSLQVGVISDTHGLLRTGAVEAMEGSDVIVHAGDVGDPGILERLGELAPVHAVRGNMDGGELGRALPATEVVRAGGADLYVLHILEELDLDPGPAGFHAVIFGHTHRPEVTRRDGVLYLNPGSAGPRRFDLPVTAARLRVTPGNGGPRLEAEIVELETGT